MGCKNCSCIGRNHEDLSEEDLEVIDMEESKDRQLIKGDSLFLKQENNDIDKQKSSVLTSTSEQVRIAEERLPTFEFNPSDGFFSEKTITEKFQNGSVYVGQKDEAERRHGRGIFL